MSIPQVFGQILFLFIFRNLVKSIAHFRFAIELNELLDNERDLLPHTDTRFRPDQRLLEVP